MQGGDISNDSPPRFLWVVENTLVEVTVTFEKKPLRSKYHRVTHFGSFYQDTVDYLWQCVWRHDIRNDLVTYLEGEDAEKAHHLVDNYGISYGQFIVTTVEEMRERVKHQLDILRVFDSDPARVIQYPRRCGKQVVHGRVMNPLE